MTGTGRIRQRFKNAVDWDVKWSTPLNENMGHLSTHLPGLSAANEEYETFSFSLTKISWALGVMTTEFECTDNRKGTLSKAGRKRLD